MKANHSSEHHAQNLFEMARAEHIRGHNQHAAILLEAAAKMHQLAGDGGAAEECFKTAQDLEKIGLTPNHGRLRPYHTQAIVALANLRRTSNRAAHQLIHGGNADIDEMFEELAEYYERASDAHQNIKEEEQRRSRPTARY